MRGDMNYRTMEAGLALDKVIAELVMGLVVVPDPVNHRGFAVREAGPHGFDLPAYSTEIKSAWAVAEKLSLWTGKFAEGEYWAFESITAYINGTVSRAPSAPLAICREAIRLVLSR